MAYEMFLSPGKIGNLTLKNRSIFPPMGSGYADADGYITQQLIDYHVRRVEGGCAMNIVEIGSVHLTSYNPHTPGMWKDEFMPGLTKLAHAIKDAGGVACIQLWHGGRQTSGKPFGGQPWAPSAIPCPMIGEMPHAMTIEEIHEVVEAYGAAAKRAKDAGFDAVELHGAHGYLIDGFLNAYTNTREDEYGGSPENRARFGIEVIKSVKRHCGEDFPVIIRMVGKENVPNGVTLEDAIQNAKWFEEAGVDAVDISQGCYTVMDYTVPPYFYPQMVNVENAAAIKKHINVPVIVAGRINTPEMAEEILQEGKADFISLGRVQLADPDYMKKVQEDRVDEIVRCIACDSGCVQNMFAGFGVSCIFNPATGHEAEVLILPTEEPKKIMVIGGGPAGLEAARVAAERGHQVTLLEKSGELGGQFLIAGMAPHKDVFRQAAIHMGYRAMKAGVDVRLNTEATAERIKKYAPDHIVLAAGSKAIDLKLEGAEHMPVYEARKLLMHQQRVRENNILVIGGGLTGLECAEVLTEQGKKVVVIDMLDQIGKDLEMYIGPYTHKYLAENNIETYPSTRILKLKPGAAVVDMQGEVKEIPCEAVVVAVGSRPESALADMVAGTNVPFDTVGDADKPGKIMSAIWSANKVARTV